MDLNEVIKQLTTERDALAAQVVILKAAYGNLAGAVNNLDEADTDSEEIIDEMWGQVFSVMQDGWNSFSREPQQCLAEIKAKEAVKGWWACWGWVDSDDKDKPTLIPAINQYAAKVRQGEQSGAWLKDSNVNGGKRQGSE